ncbi:TasA family protein [Cuneatibacter caecimuris]|uniref:Putative ribosomally synthesized peptide with SipW-like signal peptide n=1 Tax=Cuneatibacter caecimuris TaxID=1796618 RepID=A0A4Q7P499_9FIRM|nr:TasA family protein [Cuneatibacter caecimuris]RZS94268.1 putative ribosomally synthesized peptide with SipW-like signal peptide [Cuneatibacter caecimuris]
MTQSKHTKRALLASVLSVVVCAAMLVGSTFAWFTDSVTSAGNIIKSGNLDVTMEWADGTKALNTSEWKDASKEAIFNYDLWEPGYTEVRHVKISNLGSLSLKYEIRIVPTGDVGELADVIDVYYIKDGQQISDRTQLNDTNKIGTLTQILAKPYAAKGHIPAGDNAADVATIAFKMRETADNEYQGLSIGSDFAIQLVATQYTAESDSFGSDYDTDADFAATYRVSPGNIGEYLSGQHGSMSDTKLILAPGNYGKLEIGTVTAESKDDTVYICPNGNGHDGTSLTFTDIDEFKAHVEPDKWHGRSTYIRTIENLTIAAEDGVNVEGLSIVSGHMYDTQDPINTRQGGYYLTQKLSNINFVNISFTGNVDIETSQLDTVIDGVTFDGCSFTTKGTASANGQALRYYNEANNGNVKNLTVKNCTFKNCYQGIYTSHINGISVTGCTFNTIGHNAIAVQSQSVTDHKAVVIENNSFEDIKDRIIRFNGVGADTQFTIKNNTAVNSGDLCKEVIKATSLADGITYDISGNNWGEGRKVDNAQFQDSTAG